MPKTTPEQNDALVLEAFDTLFNTLDYTAAERFRSPKYIQHQRAQSTRSRRLFALIRSAPQTLRYENQLIVAEGDYVRAASCTWSFPTDKPASCLGSATCR